MNRIRGEGGRFHSGSNKDEYDEMGNRLPKMCGDSQTGSDSDSMHSSNGLAAQLVDHPEVNFKYET